MRFANTTVWVTGASSGIGRALALAFAREGAALILSGRRVAALEDVGALCPGETLRLPFEATDDESLPGIVDRAWGWRGGIDILVNNAGVSQRSLALDTSFPVYRQLIETDYLAPVHLTQLLLPRLVARKSGRLVFVASLAGKIGTPIRTGYCGAKHALVGYAEALRAEIEQAYGVGVTLVLPGSVRTGIAVNALTADGTARGVSDANIEAGIDPDAAADAIIEAVAAGAREVIVAEGIERMAADLRRNDPDALFDLLAGEGIRLAADREAGARADPMLVNT